MPRILETLRFVPPLDKICKVLQLIALKQVLLALDLEEEVDRISKLSGQGIFVEIKKLAWRKVSPELAPLLPQGMQWEDLLGSMETIARLQTPGEFAAVIKNPEQFYQSLVLDVAATVVTHVLVQNQQSQFVLLHTHPDILKQILLQLKPENVKKIISNPTAFLESLVQNSPAALQWSLVQLEQVLLQKRLLKKDTIKQLEPLLSADLKALRDGIQDPKKFLSTIKKKGVTAARQLAIGLLRAQLEDDLPEGITWQDVEDVLKGKKVAALESGLNDPEDFYARLLESTKSLAIKTALANAKPHFEKYLPNKVLWCDVEEVLLEHCEHLDTKAVQDVLLRPKRLLQSIEHGPFGKKWALAMVRHSLQKHLPHDMLWKEVVPVLEQLNVEELHHSLENPSGRALSSSSSSASFCSGDVFRMSP